MTSLSTDCPYAVALLQSHDEGDGSIQSAEDHLGSALENQELLAATRQNCPAFMDSKGCPFKNATSAEQVKETLLKIPSSHYEMSSFMQVLQGLHSKSQDQKDPTFQLPGGCPVPNEIKQASGSFRSVMEDMSLAAIMARMASEYEQSTQQQPSAAKEEDESSEEFTVDPSLVRQSAEPVEPRAPRLSQSLKTGTARAHEAAENVHFVKNFIQGIIDRHLYGHMILSLYYVYETLEQALNVHAPNEFAPCHFPKELARTGTLTEDVEYWHGEVSSLAPPSPATVDYQNRIQYLAENEPLLLLAHSYTRYLGDLSGGKVLARVARRAQEIKSAKVFKDMYRRALDDLPLTPVQIQRLVQEANVAFLLNMRLFEELDVEAKVTGATVRPVEDVLCMGPEHADATVPIHGAATSAADGSDKCPFLMKKEQQQTQGAVSHEALSKGHKIGARCPWPFVLFHDPAQFARDWQTWALSGLILCFLWSQVATSSSSSS
eukprot:CAMPEP_0168823250 /NCGR_PEP_ID=MMETSP0726-20121227/10430_1 /TAXON_ID=265536 /ORGANISM="Amphiprora sp., Strain CCMP467" /LENGTH=490 /DNA_ID=CAMNT_0008876111 /DNA_START=38 /DNA_END=1511 /DNA_ORIENTATION=+